MFQFDLRPWASRSPLPVINPFLRREIRRETWGCVVVIPGTPYTLFSGGYGETLIFDKETGLYHRGKNTQILFQKKNAKM